MQMTFALGTYCNKKNTNIYEANSCDMGILKDWSHINNMKVNVSNTKYINFDFHGFDFDREVCL